LLHFCEENEGCAFINDRKLIAGDAVGWSLFSHGSRKRRLSGGSRTRDAEYCRHIDEGFGITGAYAGTEVLVGDRHFSPRVFPVPIG
jgi:hypothetical protein